MFGCCCTAEEDETAVSSTVVKSLVDVQALHEEAADTSNDKVAITVEEAQPVEEEVPETPSNQQDVKCFTALFKRKAPEEPLGVKADYVDKKLLHICQLEEDGDNPIKRYNAENPDRPIRAGDYFITVDALKQQTYVRALVARAEIFDVEVKRAAGQNMGLDLTYSNTGTSLVIVEINDGAVQGATPQVLPGDRIVGVGDVSGGPTQLMVAIKGAAESVTLKISRPAATSES